MAGYNANNPIGNDQNSLLNALFPGRPEQQAPVGPQGAGPNFQSGQGYNQSLLHQFQSMNDPRSNSSSRVASPSTHQQAGMFRPHSGASTAQVAPNNVSKSDPNNLLHLLQQRPQPETNLSSAFNQTSFGNGRVPLDQRVASFGGNDNHKANVASRSFSQQKVASHATPDSLLALLNQPKAAHQQAQPLYESGARAQQENADASDGKPVSAANASSALETILSMKPTELPKREDTSVEKSADDLTDELANMLSDLPVQSPKEHAGDEPVDSAVHAVTNDVQLSIDNAIAQAVDADNKALVDNPEILAVIDGLDHLSVDTSKAAVGKESGKVSSDTTRVESPSDNVADDWETALEAGDSTEGQDNTKTLVDVFDFVPLTPFISITVKPDFDMPRAKFLTDDDATMAIARLKKAFDQNDRNLITATKNYIVYPMSKNGGVRVVAQDSGNNKVVFEETQDQIFNVAVCTDKDKASETVVATGCSGTVYWFMTKDSRGEIDDITPSHSFALPPIQSPGDENPGGVLKTRARKSSNHTKFFGVGRGKSIHIIFPNTITKGDFYKPGTARTVDVEKYLAHRTLKIDTGKAAKDFTFSQDDTTVVSLDKAGRIKFWDIRGLVSDDAKSQSIELTQPLLTLVTTAANEKSWPTSIIFIDKLRRVAKNTALRYLLVGMKQNHTLQLWDLALRSIVQEIYLPHDKDSDAACSVVYHVSTNTVVVGHPTRNSIYFIHLSLPRCNTSKTMSQADFVEQVGKGTFAAPKSSIAFNTICEYKFDEGVKPATGSDKRPRGDLRSLDILQAPVNKHDSTILFELYTMHSTGITSLSIRPETIGLKTDLTVIKTVSAVEAGLATYNKIKPIEQSLAQKDNLPSSPSVATSPSVQTTPQVREILRKPTVASTPQAEASILPAPASIKRADSTQKVANTSQDVVVGSSEKPEKKKKRKGSSSSRASDTTAETMVSATKPMQSIPEGSSDVAPTKRAATAADNELVMRVLMDAFTSSFEKVVVAIEQQRSTASENQLELLEIVSKTLTENVEKALGRIVLNQFETTVAPILNATIQEVLEKSVPYHLKNTLNGVVQASVAKEVQSALSGALTKALSSPQFAKNMSQMMSHLGLAREVTQLDAAKTLRAVVNSVGDLQKQRTTDAERLAALLEQRERDAEKIDNLVKQKEIDSEKVDKLEVVVRQLGELISSMASAEEKSRQSASDREDRLIAIIEQLQGSRTAASPARDAPQRYSPGPVQDEGGSQAAHEQHEEEQLFDMERCHSLVEVIAKAFIDARHLNLRNEPEQAKRMLEAALHTWLGAGDDQITQAIFDFYLIKEEPGFLFQLADPIYLFIVMRTLSSKVDSATFKERLIWIKRSIQAARNFNYHNMNATLTENLPGVVGLVRRRLETFYNDVTNDGSNDGLARNIFEVIQLSQQLLESFQQ